MKKNIMIKVNHWYLSLYFTFGFLLVFSLLETKNLLTLSIGGFLLLIYIYGLINVFKVLEIYDNYILEKYWCGYGKKKYLFHKDIVSFTDCYDYNGVKLAFKITYADGSVCTFFSGQNNFKTSWIYFIDNFKDINVRLNPKWRIF